MQPQANKEHDATSSSVSGDQAAVLAGPDDAADNRDGHMPARGADERGIGFNEDRAGADSEEGIASDDETEDDDADEDDTETEDDDEFEDDDDSEDDEDDDTETDTETV